MQNDRENNLKVLIFQYLTRPKKIIKEEWQWKGIHWQLSFRFYT